MEKIKIGIPGFDDLFKNGVRRGTSIVLNGAPGTGKSIFGLQYIYEGAKLNEPGLYITCEDTVENLKIYGKSLGFDFKKYMDEGMIHITQQLLSDKKILLMGPIIELINDKKIKRVVLDSLNLFHYGGEIQTIDLKRELLEFVQHVKSLGVTILAISERKFDGLDNIEYKTEDFMFEGVVFLTRIRKGASYERCISVLKMRAQEHLLGVYPFIIENGIKVMTKEIPFSLTD